MPCLRKLPQLSPTYHPQYAADLYHTFISPHITIISLSHIYNKYKPNKKIWSMPPSGSPNHRVTSSRLPILINRDKNIYNKNIIKNG